MKRLHISHNGLEYEFRLLEASQVVQVIKDGLFVYSLQREGKRVTCTCPGYIYHGQCWHLGMVDKVLKAKRVKQPWALWAEEAEALK